MIQLITKEELLKLGFKPLKMGIKKHDSVIFHKIYSDIHIDFDKNFNAELLIHNKINIATTPTYNNVLKLIEISKLIGELE